MATLTIKRSYEWINKFRNIAVYVDGEKLGVVANGETKSFELSPGQHELYCKIDWVSSRAVIFDFDAGRGATFSLKSFADGSFWKLFLATYFVLAKQHDYIDLEEHFV